MKVYVFNSTPPRVFHGEKYARLSLLASGWVEDTTTGFWGKHYRHQKTTPNFDRELYEVELESLVDIDDQALAEGLPTA